MSKKAKIALGILLGVILVLGVVIYLILPRLAVNNPAPSNVNENAANTNVSTLNMNENVPVGTYNESNTTLNENVSENTNTNANEPQKLPTDLEEEPGPYANVTPVGGETETSTGEKLPPKVTYNPDGTIRTVATNQMTDLDPQMLSSTCYEVMVNYCDFSDLAKRKEYLSTHLDLGKINTDDSIFYRDYVTDYRESKFISSNMYDIVVGAPTVKCYYSGGGQCTIPIAYTRVWKGDNGGGMHNQIVVDYYDVFITDDYKVWNARYLRTES